MKVKGVKSGRITIEVRILNPEKFINALWINGINIFKVRKKNTTTLKLQIESQDFIKICEIAEHKDGHVKIVNKTGLVALEDVIKNNKSLVIAAGLFFIILYFLSTYIWAIEINGVKNIAPFQVRKELEYLGIKAGISKEHIDVKVIEEKLENINSEILWVRARVEGSTLKVQIDEKINPPKKIESDYGNIVASKNGEISNIYSYGGRIKVKEGDMVKAGDILIEGIDGIEGDEYILKPSGVVMANTLYEKEMSIKIEGTELRRTGEKETEIFFEVLGKKFYLKKAIEDFQQYDRIEKSGNLINEVVYYEKKDISVNYTEEEAIKIASKELEKSLLNELSREDSIEEKIISTELNSNGELLIKIIFVVKQNIAQNTLISY